MTVGSQLTDQATRTLQDVGGSAVREGGGLVSGLLGAPFNLAGSMAREGISGVMSWGIPAALVTAGAMFFAPDLFNGLGQMTGRRDLTDRLASAVNNGGPVQALLIAAGTGAAVGGGIGMLNGAWHSITGGGQDAPQSSGAALGRTIGTVATFAAVAAVAIGAISSNHGIRHDAGGEGNVTPPPMPRGGNASREARVN